MDNQFSVTPANPLAALMLGEQSFNDARKRADERQMKAGRLEAVQTLQQGGDPRGALAKLIGIGDVQGANAIANYAHQQATQQQQAAQLTESSRHNRAAEGLQSRQIGATENAPMVIPFGAGVMRKSGEMIREPSTDALLDKDTLGAMADQYMAGDTSVLTNLGRGAQGAANVVALRQEVARRNSAAGQTGADQANRNAEFFGVKSGQRTLGNRQAQIELASTEFEKVLPIVSEASKSVNRTQYPSLNKVIQSWQEGTGDPKIVAFASGVNTLVNLYTRAISPTGVPTISDKDHAREILNRAWSQGQFDAAVGMMQKEISAAKASPTQVRDDMRGRFKAGQPGQAPAEQPATQAPAAPSIPPPPPGFVLHR